MKKSTRKGKCPLSSEKFCIEVVSKQEETLGEIVREKEPDVDQHINLDTNILLERRGGELLLLLEKDYVGLWCLTLLSTIFLLYRGVGEGRQSRLS